MYSACQFELSWSLVLDAEFIVELAQMKKIKIRRKKSTLVAAYMRSRKRKRGRSLVIGLKVRGGA